MDAVETCAHNAAIGPFFNLIQTNVLDRRERIIGFEPRLTLGRWINGTCNRRRRKAHGKSTPLEDKMTY